MLDTVVSDVHPENAEQPMDIKFFFSFSEEVEEEEVESLLSFVVDDDCCWKVTDLSEKQY